ncbi:MAG: DUF4230 domain-containing protein [Armatimonadota bacterium]
MKYRLSKLLINNLIKLTAAVIILAVFYIMAGTSIGPQMVNVFRTSINNMASRIVTVTTPSPVIVEKLQALNRLETIRQINRHIIEAKSESQILPDFLGKDKLMMQVQTETVAGVDLSLFSEKDIYVKDGTVTVHLPGPQIFYIRVDDKNSMVYTRERGLLVFHPDTDLERQARLKAQDNARLTAIHSDVLSTAQTNAEQNLRALLKTLGFKKIEFKWDKASSPPIA